MKSYKPRLRNPLLRAFRDEVCCKADEIDPKKNLCWFSLAQGFFLARGVTPKEAVRLACQARYDHGFPWYGVPNGDSK